MNDKEFYVGAFSFVMLLSGAVGGMTCYLLLLDRSNRKLPQLVIRWLVIKAMLVTPLLYFIWSLKAGYFALALLPPAGVLTGLLLTRLFVKRMPLAE